MNITIIDCYTDEPAGLSTPPYLGTYQRYAFATCIKNNIEPIYLRIDDLRFFYNYSLDEKELNPKPNKKTNTSITNLTKNHKNTDNILKESDIIIVICGSHTPGKYLSAELGTVNEVTKFLKQSNTNAKIILCGPSASNHESTHEGGKVTKSNKEIFHHIVSGDIELFLDKLLNIKEDKTKEINNNNTPNEEELRDYDFLKLITTNEEKIIEQLEDKNIICEIELGRGCPRKEGCSFCTEWIRFKNTIWREQKDIAEEIKSLYEKGIKHFRLGRQSCFYSYKNNSSKDVEILFKLIWKSCPDIKVLHIDNANPKMVITKEGEEITKLIVKYCTEQNIAAFGVESFDPEVQKQNNLNSDNETSLKAIEIINKYGKENNKFLPGINILFGLKGETKKTQEYNMKYLNEIFEKYNIRRLNIRNVTPLLNTKLANENSKEHIKNKKFYWKWRNEIRQNFDFPMLKKVYPKGDIIKDVYIRMWDGKHSFGQQLGTYPIVCGIDGLRLDIGKAYDLEIVGHNLRSLICIPKQ